MLLLHDPILLGLLGGSFLTALVLTERHLRSRITPLDAFAERRGLRCQRGASLQTLAPLEPLALVPPVVAVERLLQAPLPVSAPRAPGGPALATLGWAEVTLALCLTGNRHHAPRRLLGVFPGSPDLPALRSAPSADLADAPAELGFAVLPAPGLPEGYQTEAFQPLPRRLTQVLGPELAGTGFAIELRPGRVILAASVGADFNVDRVAALVELGLRLGPLLHQALAQAPPTGGLLPPVLNNLN